MGKLVDDNTENEKLCTCPTCPTFVKSQFKSNVFCARGKDVVKGKAAGCICPDCPVFKNYGLSQTYFCVVGKSVDIK